MFLKLQMSLKINCICTHAMNSDYILNGIVMLFVYKWVQLLADRNDFRILFLIIEISRSLMYGELVRVFVNKTLTAVSNP